MSLPLSFPGTLSQLNKYIFSTPYLIVFNYRKQYFSNNFRYIRKQLYLSLLSFAFIHIYTWWLSTPVCKSFMCKQAVAASPIFYIRAPLSVSQTDLSVQIPGPALSTLHQWLTQFPRGSRKTRWLRVRSQPL